MVRAAEGSPACFVEKPAVGVQQSVKATRRHGLGPADLGVHPPGTPVHWHSVPLPPPVVWIPPLQLANPDLAPGPCSGPSFQAQLQRSRFTGVHRIQIYCSSTQTTALEALCSTDTVPSEFAEAAGSELGCAAPACGEIMQQRPACPIVL